MPDPQGQATSNKLGLSGGNGNELNYTQCVPDFFGRGTSVVRDSGLHCNITNQQLKTIPSQSLYDSPPVPCHSPC